MVRSVEIHQTLHGYDDGHRLLSSSVDLEVGDAKTLLVLSDVSGPGSSIAATGYLTGYPLSGEGMYALARTWPAPEMPRPGCVWTHTLLMDFADLATIKDPFQLLSLHARPQFQTISEYKHRLTFNERAGNSFLSEVAASVAKTCMFALYENPNEKILYVEKCALETEQAVLAIWGQQWPRLRRSFQFCTKSFSDRSGSGTPFDLQVIPSSMSRLRSQFSGLLRAEEPDLDSEWLRVALADLRGRDDASLREFLFQAGSDLKGGRAAFGNLCSIYGHLNRRGRNIDDLERAIQLIPKDSISNSSLGVVGLVTKNLCQQGDWSSRKVNSFIVKNMDAIKSELTDEFNSSAFGAELLRSHTSLFLQMYDRGDLGNSIGKSTLGAASIGDILNAVRASPQLLFDLLEKRPGILGSSEIWLEIDLPKGEISALLNGLERKKAAISAAITAQRYDLLDVLLEHAERPQLLGIVHDAAANADLRWEATSQWIRIVATRDSVSEFLSSQNNIYWKFLLEFSELFGSGEIQNRNRSDPWLLALRNLKGDIPNGHRIRFFPYLLTRALSGASSNSGELVEVSFETTDRAAALGQLPHETWKELESTLPWPPFWQSWDKCFRIRKAVAEKCVEERWPVDVLIGVTSDDEVFATIVEMANNTFQGRQYLNECNEAPKDSDTTVQKVRRKIINRILQRSWG